MDPLVGFVLGLIASVLMLSWLAGLAARIRDAAQSRPKGIVEQAHDAISEIEHRAISDLLAVDMAVLFAEAQDQLLGASRPRRVADGRARQLKNRARQRAKRGRGR
jgi:hypothetical protein